MQKPLNFTEMIERDLLSDNVTAQMYAIRACCMTGISSPTIIKALTKLKKSSERGMWYYIADGAAAALDILGAEPYRGDNPTIKEMIATKLFSEKTA